MVSFQFNDITIILFDFSNSLVSNISRKALNRRGLQTFALSWSIIDDFIIDDFVVSNVAWVLWYRDPNSGTIHFLLRLLQMLSNEL